MNDEMKPEGQLLAAARLIERAIIQLDVSERPCGSCGSRHFNNKAHAKAYEALTNMPTNLRTAASRLNGTFNEDRGKTPTEQQHRLAHNSRRPGIGQKR